ADVASVRYAGEFFVPTVRHSLAVECATLQEPVARRRDLQTGTGEVSIKVSPPPFQGVSCFVDRQGLGNDPEAELAAFQSRLAIGDQRVEEILLRLVEKAKMSTPGRHVTND